MTVRHFPTCRVNPLAIAIALALSFVPAAHAQGFTVLHTFTGGLDGGTPYAGLAWDGRGNFYGTAAVGGYTGAVCYGLFGQQVNGCGTVFRLHQSGSNWTFSTLYEYRGGTVDGNFPIAPVTIARDGSIYGTTWAGHYNGSSNCRFSGINPPHIGCGTVFNLRPPATACTTALCSWTETIIWAFPGPNSGGGAGPGLGALVFDQAGNIYDTDFNGAENAGEVFQLVPTAGSWMPGLTYSESEEQNTPVLSLNGVTLDSAGNLYTTSQMGLESAPNCGYIYFNGCGTVFQLTPTSSGWNANVIYQFTGGADGKFPTAGLVADQAGNLYGVSGGGGAGSGGVVFELTPTGGTWTYHLIYALPDGNPGEPFCFLAVAAPACNGPWGTLLMDSAGNLYGASYGNGLYRSGNVFKLTQSNGSWTYTDLYDFTGGDDGATPAGSLVLDGNGNLYGTTVRGGSSTNCFEGCGVVFEITP
jgi:hypothetical protein